MRGIQISQMINPAIIKFIKLQSTLKYLDLTGTGLRENDIKHFVIEIAKRQSQLESLNLSDNPTINDKVAEDLCYLFTSSSTMKHLYLDQTHITIKGLKLII